MNYPENDYRNYLAHHGILGMKWGVKNGPPYPLGIGDHNASERKAGWMESLKGNISSKLRDQDKLNKTNKIAREYGYNFSGVTKDYSTALFQKVDREDGHTPVSYSVKVLLKDSFYAKANTEDDIKNMFKYSEQYRKNVNNYNSLIRKEVKEYAKNNNKHVSLGNITNMNCMNVMSAEDGTAYVLFGNYDPAFDAVFDMKKRKVSNISFY